jgi:hypothetical protein
MAQLKHPHLIAEFVKTVFSHYADFSVIREPAERAYSKSLESFIERARALYVASNTRAEKSVQSFVFKWVVDQHIKDLKLYFSDTITSKEIDQILDAAKLISDNFERIDNIAYLSNGFGVSKLYALTQDIMSGLNDGNDFATKSIRSFEKNLSKHAVILNEDYLKRLPTDKECMKAAALCIKTNYNGTGITLYFGEQLSVINATCRLINGDRINLETDSLFALMVKQHIEKASPILFLPAYEGGDLEFASRANASDTTRISENFEDVSAKNECQLEIDLPSLLELAEIIQKKNESIPLPTKNMVLVMMKLINDIADSYQDIPNSEFKGLGGIQVSEESIQHYKNTAARLAINFNNVFAGNLDGYVNYWNSDDNLNYKEFKFDL